MKIFLKQKCAYIIEIKVDLRNCDNIFEQVIASIYIIYIYIYIYNIDIYDNHQKIYIE